MKLELQHLPEFTVAGKLGMGDSSKGPEWILPLWAEGNSRFAEIESLVLKRADGLPKGCWGAMGNPNEFLGRWTEQGLYLAGYEVEKDASVPDGWTKWTIPEQTYLVADCTQESYGHIFSEVLMKYLPEYNLSMIGAAHEFYPEPNNPDHVMIYFPIAAGKLFCQSCGMPMMETAHLGNEADGSPNYDYCCYCYQNGAFCGDCTMEEMVESCLDIGREMGMYPDLEQARRDMLTWFPTLKRWKK